MTYLTLPTYLMWEKSRVDQLRHMPEGFSVVASAASRDESSPQREDSH